MARGRTPSYYRAPRADNLRELLHNLRLAHRNVLIAEGHLLAHQRAEDDAARRARDAGATHRELVEACGQRWVRGKVVRAFRPKRRRHAA